MDIEFYDINDVVHVLNIFVLLVPCNKNVIRHVTTHLLLIAQCYPVHIIHVYEMVLEAAQILATETELSESEMETEVTVIEKTGKSDHSTPEPEEKQTSKTAGR